MAMSERESGSRGGRFGRPAVVTACFLFGLTLLAMAWWGVSSEVTVDEQIVWLVGAAVPGLFFVVLGGVLLASRELRRFATGLRGTADDVEVLHERLVRRAGARVARRSSLAADATEPAVTVVVLPSATTYHRPECRMVAGKKGAERVARDDLDHVLAPCRLCEPDGAQTAS
jgi:hypothetical protein